MKKLLSCLLGLLVSINVAAEPHTQKLSVVLDWFPNPDHAPLIIAMEQGFFKAEGLDVELISPSDPTDPAKLVAAGKADIGITYEPEYMQQVDRGLPIISIGTLIDKPLNCLVALKDGKISTLSDLKGKRIGTSGSGLSSVMLRVMLEKQGLSNQDVEFITVHYGLTQALLSHKVDAVSGMMRNFEVPALELNNHKVDTFFPEENGIPNYSELIFISNTAQKNDRRFPRFMKAIQNAVAWLDAHPNDGWKDFTQKYPEANNPVNREAWFATLPYFADEPAQFNQEEWLNFAKFMQEHQLISKIQPASRYTVKLKG